MRYVRFIPGLVVFVLSGLGCRQRSSDPMTGETTEGSGTAEIRSGEPGKPATNLPPFEGELKVDVAGKGTESLDYAMKGNKIRLGLGPTGKADKGIDAIIDTREKTATILFNDRKEFAELDLTKLVATAKKRLENADVERTGKTSTIAGHECEQWTVRDKDFRVSACVMKGGPLFDLDALEQQGNFVAPTWVHRIVDAGYVPLRVEISDANGRSLGSAQVSDTSKTVEASSFDIPVGYKKVAPSKSLAPTSGPSKAKAEPR